MLQERGSHDCCMTPTLTLTLNLTLTLALTLLQVATRAARMPQPATCNLQPATFNLQLQVATRAARVLLDAPSIFGQKVGPYP